MPRPGFYNDNEYRAYPFIYAAPQPLPAATLPTSLIVDAGIVMGLDADFDAAVHSVWLASVQLTGGLLRFTLATDAPGALSAALIFSRDPSGMWETEFVESGTAVATAPCATEPIWEGFLTTGTLTDFVTGLSGTAITFTKNQYQLEPARIQNLAKSYLRSISVGNFSRTNVPACDEVNTTERPVVLNARCIQGDIRIKEGYHCAITQTDRANEISISAGLTSGITSSEELCAVGSEIPLFDGEPIPEGSKFYGGGPACADLITIINGLGGRVVSITGGTGVQVSTATDKITIALDTNSQNNCAPN